MNVDGFMAVYSAVILIMAPDSQRYSEAHADRQAARQIAGTVCTKCQFNMQNLIQLKK